MAAPVKPGGNGLDGAQKFWQTAHSMGGILAGAHVTLRRLLVGAFAVVAAIPPLMAIASQRSSAALAREWTSPRTPDGHPDLQGYWTNETFTPLERPSELGDKAFFTEQEAASYLKRRLDQFLAQSRADVHYDDAIWQGESYDSEPNLQTSLILDPADGKIPPLTPQAAKRAQARAQGSGAHEASGGVKSRTLAERCISWGNVGPPMIPPSYNANLQILQARDHVVIRHEMIHDVRIIPVVSTGDRNGSAGPRPHLGPNIRMLAGDSRGRWDGDTLVVETTNFTDKTNFRGPPRHTRQDILASDALHVAERFTRVAANRIRYQFTVRDPATWTHAWSGEVPLRRFGGPFYEYACHEGNYGLTNILRALASDASRGTRP